MAPDGRLRVLVDSEAQLGRESDCPQDPEGVLGKTGLRIPYAAYKTCPKVLHPMEAVHQSLPVVIGHGVDGEVPPCQVLPQGGGKGNGFGMASVPVVSVHPVGGDLIAPEDGFLSFLLLPQKHRYGAMLDPCIHGLPEDRLHLLRMGGGGHVPVLRLPSQDAVPDAASHGIGLVACLLQLPDDILHIVGQNDLHIQIPVCSFRFL